VLVRGRVQGVSFRMLTCERARSRGVAGWVQNRPDGAVEAAFEGPEEAVRSLVDWCRRGPVGAVVASVDVAWEMLQGEHEFTIR
jgi:acylphosphatase